MVTVHAAYVQKKNPRAMLGLWAAVCGSKMGPLSTDINRVNCEACKRVMKERGLIL